MDQLCSRINRLSTFTFWKYAMPPGFLSSVLRSSSTSITRIKKSVYPRVYKVRLQQPDGSTFTIRYHEPHELIRLPVDPNSLTEEEKRERLMRSKPEKEIKVQEFDDEETEITQRSWKDFVPSK